ncbi:hypothetical protein O6H91_05G058800 [Diphasiastrum complanatum]|uniref:Uncharacterized protein n=1 Tax=Diphasiastrum complanatum TaxID=34168 RepID=A0ACC2DNL1_DIPCM|nr:hypothetical protein O6H91_05G058800 [Diphasiastrum complanatum]
MGAISASVVGEGSIPTPGFEGFEKRLEVEFSTFNASNEHELRQDYGGLRAISRAEIDTMLSAAECTIVSQLSNNKFDSYVLSESSLFLYPFKIVIKTCGTTQILKTIPQLLASASRLSLRARRCKYSRGSFLFPHAQPFPHGSFAQEVKILDKFFTHLCGKAFTMGDPSKYHNWHIYIAANESDYRFLPSDDPAYTLEMCMTGLDKQIAAKFYKAVAAGSAKEMTTASGINELLPNSHICDFAFDPCGYSMNGIEDNAHSTIHITPEEGFSYASFETMGYGPGSRIELRKLVDRVAACFKPAFLSISLYVCGDLSRAAENVGSWDGSVSPSGYVCDGSSRQVLPGGSAVIYHTYRESAEDCCNIITPFSLFTEADPCQVQSFGCETKKVSNVADEDPCFERFFADQHTDLCQLMKRCQFGLF